MAKQGVVGVGNRLALGWLAYQNLAVVGVGDDGRGGTCAFSVFDDFGFIAVQDSHTGVWWYPGQYQ